MIEIYEYPDGHYSHLKSHPDAILWGSIEHEFGSYYKLHENLFSSNYPFIMDKSFGYMCDNNMGHLMGSISIYAESKLNPDDGALIIYSSDKPLCFGNSQLTDLICCFLRLLKSFDTVEEASVIFNLENPLKYKNPEKLLRLLSEVTSILYKYHGRKGFTISGHIINWIKTCMGRFGYTLREIRQQASDVAFLKITENLNRLGFLIENNADTISAIP